MVDRFVLWRVRRNEILVDVLSQNGFEVALDLLGYRDHALDVYIGQLVLDEPFLTQGVGHEFALLLAVEIEEGVALPVADDLEVG